MDHSLRYIIKLTSAILTVDIFVTPRSRQLSNRLMWRPIQPTHSSIARGLSFFYLTLWVDRVDKIRISIPCKNLEFLYLVFNSIRSFPKCEVQTKKSVLRVTVRHHEVYWQIYWKAKKVYTFWIPECFLFFIATAQNTHDGVFPQGTIPASILNKSTAGRYRPVNC